MSLTIVGGLSKQLSASELLTLLKTVDSIGSGLDADLVRGAGPMGAPPIPGGTAGVPVYGQVFAPQRPPAYPASLFKV